MTAKMIVEHVALPDHEMRTEQVVLGAMLMQGDACLKVVDVLTSEMFADDRHKHIYAACRALYVSGEPVDIVTVCEAMRLSGTLDMGGGPEYVVECAKQVTGGANLEHHARIIVQLYLDRRIRGLAAEIAEDASPDAFDKLDRISAKVTDMYAVTQPTITTSAADGIGELLDKKPAQHYTFGIPELDRIAVLEAGLPVIMAGRPGIGKSILCVEVCWHLTLKGPVMLFSPEMTVKQIQSRILAREAEVPYSVIIRGRMDEQQLDSVTAAWARIGDRLSLLKIDPQSGITPEQVRVRTERAMKAHGVIAIAVDHLHKMRTGDLRVDRDDFSRITQCMNGLTNAAKNTGLPALVMCQLNRGVESRTDKRPNMADLRGSGAIEEDAAVVGLLYREGYYKHPAPYTDTLEINVAKNRDGALDVARATITPAHSRIGDPIVGAKEVTREVETPF